MVKQTGFLLFASLMTLTIHASAAVQLARLFSEGAVLQRDQPLPVFGTAPPNTEVTVTLGQSVETATSNAEGDWRVAFAPLSAGGPVALKVTAGEESAQVQNLYVGDVWVASGQSNMEWVLRDAAGGEAEIRAADLPQVRQYKVPLTWAATPEDELAGGAWRSATGAQKGDFSAVGYFFAKRIHAETGVPIGLISSNWGGSSIEAWMSPDALGTSVDETARVIEKLGAESQKKYRELRKTLQRWPNTVVEQLNPEGLAKAPVDWSARTLDTKDWLPIEAPGAWEGQGFPGMDGVVWYRTTFTLSEAQAAGEVELGLGRIDDNDETFINGHKIGSTQGYDVVRRYTVPHGALRAGGNTLAVRIVDGSGGGGIYSSPDLLYVQSHDGERQSLVGTWKMRPEQVTLGPIGNLNQVATALYNKMLHPLYDFPVKGVIWYQGESNADNLEEAERYAEQFQAMIKDWRRGWSQPQMPFYWVQLANFNSRTNTDAGKPWAVVREAQTAALELPYTGQAITIDVGDAEDIHPRDKKTVGERLARIALNQSYGKQKVHYRGPVLGSVSVKNGSIVVGFETGKSLAVRGKGKTVQGFEVVSRDGNVKPVTGKISGSSVVLPVKASDQVVAVRYAWDDNPQHANLMDKSGLPAEPFRTEVK